jgi:hypothetical protein
MAKEVSQDMTIKQLTDLLQKRIDGRLKCFTEHYDKMRAINKEVEELEKKMYIVITELEPVQSLIYNQNPSLERIFESIKRVYGSIDNGNNGTSTTTDNEAN